MKLFQGLLLHRDCNPATISYLQNAPPCLPLKFISYHCGLTGYTPVALALLLFLCFDKLVPILRNLRKLSPLCIRLFPQIFVWLALSHHSGSSLNITFPEITQFKVATQPLHHWPCFNDLHSLIAIWYFLVCLLICLTAPMSVGVFS